MLWRQIRMRLGSREWIERPFKNACLYHGRLSQLSETVGQVLAITSQTVLAHSSWPLALEPQSNYDPLRRDGISPHLRLAPSLMQIENLSLQSLSRSSRGVGVTDLREALEGRGSMSNPALANRAPSLSTLDHAPTYVDPSTTKLRPTRSRPEKPRSAGGPAEVRDMLSKLHIGKPGNGSNLLRASFPGLQRQEAR